ncbi:MAG: hypothetical protein WC473_06080 [Patescibacteria group bacterium]
MAVSRNLQKEQEALKTFGKSQGKMPSTAEDWKLLHQYAYGANLPDEFKDAQSEAAPSAGLTPITPPSTTGFNPEAGIGELAGQVEQAGADVSKFSSPTMATNILQEAIREKTGVAQAGIGESEIFKKAGISGYAPLAQSLNTRGDELAINQAAFQNIITGMAGNYRDMATAAKDRYDMAFNNYQLKKDELLEAERDAREHAQALEIIDINFKNQKSIMTYEDNLAKRETVKAGASWRGDEITLGPGGDCGTVARKEWSTITEPMGDTLREKKEWIDRLGTRGIQGIGVGDIVITDGRDLGLSGSDDETGHVLIVGDMDKDGNMYAYESNAKGDGEKTFGRWVNPGTVYGYIGGGGNPYGVMKPEEFEKMQQIAMSYKGTLGRPEQSDQGKFTPEFYATDFGQKVLNNEQQYQTNFLSQPVVKDFIAVQNKSASVSQIIDAGVGGPGDLAIVYEFMKGLDPSSVVRESEYASAAKSGNIFQGWAAKYNGYLKEKGGILPDAVKNSFKDILQTKLGVYQKQYNQLRDQYRKTAEEQGLNPEHVAPNLEISFREKSSDTGEQSNSNDPLGVR